MRAGSAIAAGGRHAFEVGLQALVIAAIIAAVALAMSAVYRPAGFVAGLDTADAARAGGGHIAVPDGYFGGTTVATTNPGGDVAVHAQCFQSGVAVWAQVARVDANNQAVLTLGPTPRWTGGDADCTAAEGYWTKTGRWRVLAETTFHVSD
jgi:hypothetical protein